MHDTRDKALADTGFAVQQHGGHGGATHGVKASQVTDLGAQGDHGRGLPRQAGSGMLRPLELWHVHRTSFSRGR